jgi:hypothetical protein
MKRGRGYMDDFDKMIMDLERIKGRLVEVDDIDCMTYMIRLVKNLQKMDAMLELSRSGGKYDA